jgi:hypothetical protein
MIDRARQAVMGLTAANVTSAPSRWTTIRSGAVAAFELIGEPPSFCMRRFYMSVTPAAVYAGVWKIAAPRLGWEWLFL